MRVYSQAIRSGLKLGNRTRTVKYADLSDEVNEDYFIHLLFF